MELTLDSTQHFSVFDVEQITKNVFNYFYFYGYNKKNDQNITVKLPTLLPYHLTV